MPKSTYKVFVIKSGREQDYYDFWYRDIQTNSEGEELDSYIVCLAVLIDADNLEVAVSKVQSLYPNLRIDIEFSHELDIWTSQLLQGTF